jgi:hypothetical protein
MPEEWDRAELPGLYWDEQGNTKCGKMLIAMLLMIQL